MSTPRHLTTSRTVIDLTVRRTQAGADLLYDVLRRVLPDEAPSPTDVLVDGAPMRRLRPDEAEASYAAINLAFPETEHAGVERIDGRMRLPEEMIAAAMTAAERTTTSPHVVLRPGQRSRLTRA